MSMLEKKTFTFLSILAQLLVRVECFPLASIQSCRVSVRKEALNADILLLLFYFVSLLTLRNVKLECLSLASIQSYRVVLKHKLMFCLHAKLECLKFVSIQSKI